MNTHQKQNLDSELNDPIRNEIMEIFNNYTYGTVWSKTPNNKLIYMDNHDENQPKIKYKKLHYGSNNE